MSTPLVLFVIIPSYCQPSHLLSVLLTPRYFQQVLQNEIHTQWAAAWKGGNSRDLPLSSSVTLGQLVHVFKPRWCFSSAKCRQHLSCRVSVTITWTMLTAQYPLWYKSSVKGSQYLLLREPFERSKGLANVSLVAERDPTASIWWYIGWWVHPPSIGALTMCRFTFIYPQ